MPGENEKKPRLSRKERRLIILVSLLLAALVGLAIWAALSTNYDKHWPPPTID
jgi:hypothetical protein